MNNVINFPLQSESRTTWDIVVAGVMEPATRAGASNEKVEEFLEKFKPIYDQFLFEHSVKLPPMSEELAKDVTIEMRDFERRLQNYNMDLIMERLLVEVARFDWSDLGE